ncbi:hypothetical protein [Streptomyces sp. BE230]|uniref:hypothetical protein n=1 Tax=Streptomyces sp. BE230 TaxID=3002526 RepID=UPI002ED187F5|nr:hypothetical protein [Streptomyces sp. BE230]
MVRDRWVFAAEVAFVLVAVVGIGLWSVPAALLVGGVLGVLACERASVGRAAGGQHGGSGAGGERQ